MSLSRTVSEIFIVKEWRDLKTGNRSRSRSLKMAPFDRWLSIGRPLYSSMLYHFRVIWRWIIVTLKSRLYIAEGHSNWYHSKAWVRLFFDFHYGHIFNRLIIRIIITVNLNRPSAFFCKRTPNAFMRYAASKNSVTLKTGLGVVQGHWKWRRSIEHIWISIGPPL